VPKNKMQLIRPSPVATAPSVDNAHGRWPLSRENPTSKAVRSEEFCVLQSLFTP
jgi:hypothetical protein